MRRLGRPVWGDVSGGFGDVGTMIPIFLSLAALCGLPPGRSLSLVGAVYVLAALFFRIPVPVQPLKAMAAIAIANGLGMPMIQAAALWMGLILLLAGSTGIIEWLSRWFTRPVVKGIQLGVGLMLLKAAVMLLLRGVPLSAEGAEGAGFPGLESMLPALWLLVIPQLPLTLGNAVYASADVARDYFGHRAHRATPRNLALSLGGANLAAGLLGGLPVCHGSGGLTAHVRCGARTPWATVIAGSVFLVAGLVLRERAPMVLRLLPVELLSVLVGYVGLCHVMLIRGLDSKRPLAWGMGAAAVLSGNLAMALALGLVLDRVWDAAEKRALSGRVMGT